MKSLAAFLSSLLPVPNGKFPGPIMIHLTGDKPSAKIGEYLQVPQGIWNHIAKRTGDYTLSQWPVKRILSAIYGDDRPWSVKIRHFLRNQQAGISVWDDSITTPKVRYVHRKTAKVRHNHAKA